MMVRRLVAALAFGGLLLVSRDAASPPQVLAASETAAGIPARPLPVRLIIPAIHVDAAIEQVGDTPDGTMEAPRAWQDVGWYGLGFRPGDVGSAVIAGHLDSITDRAVFWDLNRLRVGDEVNVQDDDGSHLTFAVVGRMVYAADNAPLEKIFGPAEAPGLNLVTCNGSFDWGSGNYDKRLVVYTRQLGTTA
jgi:sortase A